MKQYFQHILHRIQTYFFGLFNTLYSRSEVSSDDAIDNNGYRQLNWLLCGLFAFGVMNFVAGYFWGQRKAVEYFVKRIEEDSFADRISYALYTMNDRDSGEFEDADTNEVEVNESSETENGDENGDTDDESDTENEAEGPKEQEVPSIAVPVVTPPSKTVSFARLAGFGSRKAAQTFLERITILDPKATISERLSTTSRGKKITWYQVITGEFEDTKDLDRIIQLIKHKEHINEVQVVTRQREARANDLNPKKG